MGLLKLCYEVYSFCRSAPSEVQGLASRLERIGQKLNRFSTILEKSGLGSWKETPNLQQHLLEAQAFVEPLRSTTHESSSLVVKIKGFTRLAIHQGKLKRIEKIFDVDERIIDDMKIDLILYVCKTEIFVQVLY